MFTWANAVAFSVGSQHVLWSDLLGNICSLATVAFALRRSLLTWPVQIAGCVLLFGASVQVHLGGNAARQVVLALMALYGWSRWAQARRTGGPQHTRGEVTIRFASGRERAVLLVLLVGGTIGFAALLQVTNTSYSPLPDAYIFIGSVAATLAQARGLVEFWAIWILVDCVGVPLAWTHGLVVSGSVYAIFLVMVLAGLRDWIRRGRSVPQPWAPAEVAG